MIWVYIAIAVLFIAGVISLRRGMRAGNHAGLLNLIWQSENMKLPRSRSILLWILNLCPAVVIIAIDRKSFLEFWQHPVWLVNLGIGLVAIIILAIFICFIFDGVKTLVPKRPEPRGFDVVFPSSRKHRPPDESPN